MSETQRHLIRLKVNGDSMDVAVKANATLLEVLREDLDLTGTKHGCELGECGLCTVLINGEPRLSCLTLGIEAEGADILTIEGVADKGQPDLLQLAFGEIGGSQCGYCTSGMVLSAKALLERNPRPTREEIREALSGNLCRCTGYQKIVDAVEQVARTERPL
jgi:aerobic carbon-monoxide dehydrogenase small subunit